MAGSKKQHETQRAQNVPGLPGAELPGPGVPGGRVLIAGASSGIGAACAQRFAKEGWDVCLTARRAGELEKVRATLAPGDHLVVPGDCSEPATAMRLGETIGEHWGALDVLVNSVGVNRSVPAIGSDLAAWRHCLDLMLDSAVHLTRTAAALMPTGGRIVHITSIHAQRAERGSSGYGMAKAAIEQYVRSLALELADRNILANAIAPGFVDTPMSSADGVNELETDWFQDNYVRGDHLPLRRAGRPEEIAGVAWFLAGADASYITGQTLTVDGGLTITF